MEKVITGLELCTNISPDGCLMLCPYKDEKDETYSGFCEQVLKQDALAILKEQPNIVRCKDCIHWHQISITNDGFCWNHRIEKMTKSDFYCADGVKRDG